MGRKARGKPEDDGAAIIAGLRHRVLTTQPADIGFTPGDGAQVYGVLMEIGYDDAVVSIVSLADGTTSMYISNGGGTIGAGEHDAVANASRAFVSVAEDFAPSAEVTADFPLPGEGMVRFQFLTYAGGRTTEAGEDELGNKIHSQWPLFYAGQDVITAIRRAQDAAGG